MLTNFRRSLLAVLLGTLLYFGVFERFLPLWAQHQSFQVDAGFAVIALICLAIYGLLFLAERRWADRRR